VLDGPSWKSLPRASRYCGISRGSVFCILLFAEHTKFDYSIGSLEVALIGIIEMARSRAIEVRRIESARCTDIDFFGFVPKVEDSSIVRRCQNRRQNATSRGKFRLLVHAHAPVPTRQWVYSKQNSRGKRKKEREREREREEEKKRKRKNSSPPLSSSYAKSRRRGGRWRQRRPEIKVALRLLLRKTERRGALDVVCSRTINRIETRPGLHASRFPVPRRSSLGNQQYRYLKR